MFLSALLFALSQLETEFNAVERLKSYCDDIPQELEMTKPTDPDLITWPINGAIEFRNVSFAYPSNPELLILKHLNFNINAGEKIGIVGRTGSGKSTLTNALFRLSKLNHGTILIDGLDISTLGLKTTRSRLQIIPQSPVLFSGTIKSNLDVESLYLEQQIWKVLEQIGLKQYVESLNEKLDSVVAEGGENLSVGQRQLICLGRAILSKPIVLVMDEATASVDRDADIKIQQSIKTTFKNTTVLCIAHRLNTIADFDRILVLNDGMVMEFDTPERLLNDPNSHFYKLAQATGNSNFKILLELATK